jgi:hypothetical protein
MNRRSQTRQQLLVEIEELRTRLDVARQRLREADERPQGKMTGRKQAYEDLLEKNVLMLEEVWSAEENLDLHIRSDEYHNLLLALELALKRPEIRFDTISGSTGIETIEKARNRA